MDKSIKIHCPNCSTEFLHLNSLGKQKVIDTVRCGACFTVFKIPVTTLKTSTDDSKTQKLKQTTNTNNSTKSEETLPQKDTPPKRKNLLKKDSSFNTNTQSKPHKNSTIKKKGTTSKPSKTSTTTKNSKNSSQNISEKYKNTQPATLRLKQFSSKSKKKTPYSLKLICLLFFTACSYSAYQFLLINKEDIFEFFQNYNCLTGNCEQKTAINHIKSLNINIKKLEDNPEALWVRAIIINTADTPERYPNIKLSFSDISGITIKKLIVTPDDYLNTQLITPNKEPLMTPHQEVQLGFSIPDPKIAPLNYSLSLSY